MQRNQIINKFTKSLVKEKKQGNAISASQITSTLINAALTLAFVNESCKSSGQISKSQVIYPFGLVCQRDSSKQLLLFSFYNTI